MFGSSKNDSRNKSTGVPATPSTASSNSLVQGTQMEGTLQADNDIRIDGTLKGTLICKGKVIIGPTGFITGDIQCENAVIEGRFEGVLLVGDVLHVKETAEISGDVSTQKLVVQPGSIFNVKCKMGNGTTTSPKRVLLDDEEEEVELDALRQTNPAMS